jgi:hypothetical protein
MKNALLTFGFVLLFVLNTLLTRDYLILQNNLEGLQKDHNRLQKEVYENILEDGKQQAEILQLQVWAKTRVGYWPE